jgi:hypothetical protein
MLALTLAICFWPSIGKTTQDTARTVRGDVVATNVKDQPHTIVVRVMTPNRQELIVGARVPSDTRIKLGNRSATLADVRVGAVVHLTYLKNPDGLVARSITVP